MGPHDRPAPEPFAPAETAAYACRTAVIVASLTLAGCAGAFDVASIQMVTASLGANKGASLSRSPVNGQETYIRIARGANACWFGAKGAYRETHVFYAETQPSHKGGTSDITIHERDKTGERPWGLKTLRINLVPVDEQTDVSIVNLKMSDADLQRMTGEVARWIQGEEGCAPVSAPAAAVPVATPSAPPPAPKAVKPK